MARNATRGRYRYLAGADRRDIASTMPARVEYASGGMGGPRTDARLTPEAGARICPIVLPTLLPRPFLGVRTRDHGGE